MDIITNATEADSADMFPPHAAECHRYNRSEWEAHRITIMEMYPKKGVTIREIREHLLKESAFRVR